MAAYSLALLLRGEISLRALSFAEHHGLPHEGTIGSSSAIIFRESPEGVHGNFYGSSFRRIRATPEWMRRLTKVHTSAARRLVSHDPDRKELDTAVSSDALLMNVFCHPRSFSAAGALRTLLATEAPEHLEFGFKPRIPLLSRQIECTEVDLRIGRLLIEAKLTETDFQRAPHSRVERYRDFTTVFDVEALPQVDGYFRHYQLIRGALAAFAETGTRFCLVCDTRRPDLIESWFAVARAVRMPALRSRLQLITWQELAAAMPKAMRAWLDEKYGIIPAV